MTPDARNGNGAASQNVISFGPFLLYVTEGVLERRVPVRLGRHALDILLVLVNQVPDIVGKGDLMARVWPNGMVEEKLLRSHIMALREALGDGTSGARYVTRVSDQGYCFVAPTSCVTLTPRAMNDGPSLLSSRPSRALDERRLQRVLEFVEAKLETDIKVEDLASVAALSQFHFSRAFRRATGKTPHRFVSDRRLEKAKGLLVEGTLSLADIAATCNFASQASFTRAFRRAVGLPPGEYRRLRR